MPNESVKLLTSKLDILAGYQVIGGLSGLGLTIYLMTTLKKFPSLFILLVFSALLLYCYSVFCGILLLTDPVRGLKYSRLNQFLQ